MCPSEERYYTKEHSGYPIRIGVEGGGGKRAESVEVLVLDRAYCHRVVWSSWWAFGDRSANHPRRLAKNRAKAADLCAQWNAEDRADAA